MEHTFPRRDNSLNVRLWSGFHEPGPLAASSHCFPRDKFLPEKSEEKRAAFNTASVNFKLGAQGFQDV